MQRTDVISRKDAITSGLKRYFTGVECAKGHLSPRLVSDCSCMECSRIKNADRLRQNRDAINEARREKRSKNAPLRCESDRVYRTKNKDAVNAKRRKLYSDKIEENRLRQRNYYLSNIERKRAYARLVQSSRYSKNPDLFRALAMKNRAIRKNAVPSWFGEFDAFVWDEACTLAALRRSLTRIDWHADHMIPIQAKTVFGLHVWNNCQVIPAVLNNAKNNRLTLTRPHEWLLSL